MAPSIPLLYILFTIGALPKFCNSVSQIELGVHFLEEPEDVIGVPGKSLSLPCRPMRSNRQKDFEIKWYHNNTLMNLANDRRRTIFPNGTLHISKLVHRRSGHSDQGEYRCVIAKENGSLSSRPAFLRISVLPKNFSLHPVKQVIEIGSNVRLSCEIDLFSELEVEWGKDDEKLPQNDLKYLIVSGPSVRGSILYIFNVVPEDSGSYRCTAKNILLNKQRLSSSGLVIVLPLVGESGLNKNLTFLSAQRSSRVKEIKEGDNITLDCVANGSPTPELFWNYTSHDNNTLQPILNKANFGYNILQINNITRRQAGRYTCVAMNSFRKEVVTDVQVLTAPEIQEKSDNMNFRASKTVRFRCIVTGNPLPGIYWLKDGNMFNITGRIKHRTSVNESRQLRSSELILSSTVSSDAGIYQCMAYNVVGSTWAASRLVLDATGPAPKAPEKVVCETVSSSQIKITWDVPTTTEKIKAFSVHYHLTENGEEIQAVLPSDSRSTQIERLLPFTNYTFYVRLYIDFASEFSQKIVCQTGEEVPIEAPRLKLKIASPNSVHLSWLPLPKEKARGIVNRYKIQWRVTGSPSSKVKEVTSDITDYIITGLIPGKNYEVRVLAATSQGWSDIDFPWTTLEIPPNFHLPSSPEVKLQAINSSSIEVKWSFPNRGTQIEGYKLFYRKHNSSQLGPVTIPSEVKEYVITGLDPETWYEVTVLGFTKVDDEETGSNSTYTLSKERSSNQLPIDFSSVLAPPSSLEAEPVSPVAINLSWNSPQLSSGSNRISFFTICFNSVQTSRSKTFTGKCLKSYETKILIESLDPFTLYEFKVKSHDIYNKQSAFSQTVECYTLEDVPSSVTDVSWKALNKTTVQVMWKKPKQSNGIIRNYTISYTRDTNLPLNKWNVTVVSASDSKAHLTGLTSNVKYYFLVRAATNPGLGSYESPEVFLISSPKEVLREEPAPKTSKDKQTDHYIGIMVGLGIGLCCIILCTICILCRRKCLKSHITQDFEVFSARYSNGNDCRREREVVREPLEAEYFTFLSAQRDRLNSVEISLQHLDTKGRCPNATANGIRMSLLNEGRSPSDNGKGNVCITENPRYDPNSSESPLLRPRTYSKSLNCGNESPELSKFLENRRNSSKSLRSGKRYSLEIRTPGVLYNNNNFEVEVSKKPSTSDVDGQLSYQSGEEDEEEEEEEEDNVQRSSIYGRKRDKSNDDERWSDLNSVLKNPDFRFSSPSSEKYIKRKNGFAVPGHFRNMAAGQNGVKENGTIRDNEDGRNQPINGICAPSDVSLRMLSKEITMES